LRTILDEVGLNIEDGEVELNLERPEMSRVEIFGMVTGNEVVRVARDSKGLGQALVRRHVHRGEVLVLAEEILKRFVRI